MAGAQTAAAMFGGSVGPNFSAGNSAAGEEYDGTSWSETNDLNTARRYLAGAGTQTAGLGISGYNPGGNVTNVELYDGTNWSNGTVIPTATAALAASGTQTAAIVFGGNTGSDTANSLNFDGSSWTAGATMATARDRLTGSPAGTQTVALAVSGATNAPSTATEEFSQALTTRTMDVS